MPKMTDYVALWGKYQREGVPQKISIERFCVMNGYTYKQLEQRYKTDQNVSFTLLDLRDLNVSSVVLVQIRVNHPAFKSSAFAWF